MAEENRNPAAGAAEEAGGVGPIVAAVCEELGFANRIYDLAVRMKEELGGVTGEPQTDSAAAARLVQIEHEARQALRRAVETENRLMEQLGRMARETPPEPETGPASGGADAPADAPAPEDTAPGTVPGGAD